MKYEFNYNKGKIEFDIQPHNYGGILLPNEIDTKSSEDEEIMQSLSNPIGSKRLKDIVQVGESVAIVTSDITRPMPSAKVLPHIIYELNLGGIKEKNITIVLALGSHRPHTEEEKEYLVGKSVYKSSVKIIDSDITKCINLGMCKNGTPVDIFEPVVNSNRIICMGNIEYHYFAGYSGGAKAIMPGVSSHRAIQANHSNMIKVGAKAGNLDSNPVRQDIDEVPRFINIDFLVNVILDTKKKIVKVVSGHWKDAHRSGCKVLDDIYGVKLQKKADIVIVSPGGYPKDLNLYQSQKALDNSKHAVRDGGIIILTASAKEGFGEHVFEDWMLNKSPEEMIVEIERNFILGGHKAAAIAMILQKNQIFLVSDFDEELAKKINMTPFKSAQAAVDEAIRQLGQDSKVVLMPSGGSTLPILQDSSCFVTVQMS